MINETNAIACMLKCSKCTYNSVTSILANNNTICIGNYITCICTSYNIISTIYNIISTK